MKEQVEKITDLDLDREQYYTLQDTPKFSCLKLIERKIVYSATSSTETALGILEKYSKPSIYRASIYRVPLFTGPSPFPPIFLPRYFPIKFGNLLVRFEM